MVWFLCPFLAPVTTFFFFPQRNPFRKPQFTMHLHTSCGRAAVCQERSICPLHLGQSENTKARDWNRVPQRAGPFIIFRSSWILTTRKRVQIAHNCWNEPPWTGEERFDRHSLSTCWLLSRTPVCSLLTGLPAPLAGPHCSEVTFTHKSNYVPLESEDSPWFLLT